MQQFSLQNLGKFEIQGDFDIMRKIAEIPEKIIKIGEISTTKINEQMLKICENLKKLQECENCLTKFSWILPKCLVRHFGFIIGTYTRKMKIFSYYISQ